MLVPLEDDRSGCGIFGRCRAKIPRGQQEGRKELFRWVGKISCSLCNTARECVVRVGEICALESEGNYTQIYLVEKDRILVRRSLGWCLARLDPKIFVRLCRGGGGEPGMREGGAP